MRQLARPPFADAKKRRQEGSGRGTSHYNPLQARGGNGRWISTGARIDRAIALAGQNGAHHETLALVRKPATISKLTDRDVRGFRHAISNESVVHARKRHPDLTVDDFHRIPAVIRSADVALVDPAPNGSPRIRYRATVDGVRYGYVTEVRRKQKRLDMVTFYRR